MMEADPGGETSLEEWLYAYIGELSFCCALARSELATNPDLERLTLDFICQVMDVATAMCKRANMLLVQRTGDVAIAAPTETAPTEQICRMDRLTRREIEVLRYLDAGLRPKDIAAHLVLALDTVQMHIRHVVSKLHAHGYADAVRIAREQGILVAPFH